MVFIARVFDTARHHADNCKGLRIEGDLSPDNIWISAELCVPKPVAHYHLQAISRDFFVFIKFAPKLQLEAKNVKIS